MNGSRKIELCRRLAKKIMSTNIKYHLIFRPFFRVENPCGKTCGQCGKLRVFNSYSVSFPRGANLWKSPDTGLHNSAVTVFPACYVTARFPSGQGIFRRKSLDVVKKCCQKPSPPGPGQNIFVENRQNKWLYHPPLPGNTFPIRFFRRSSCREK